ncbi:MAG: endonuclease/exonuclease/phosphatase family protein [Chromatiales bacterium]|jgi:endonuclease/exonuclease/phosphatase family metal-dependent hydrolase
MPSLPKPSFTFDYSVNEEIANLHQHRASAPGRDIPLKSTDRLLLASWNVANLGLHRRRDNDYRLLAEIIGWFDLIAIQEVNDNLDGLRAIKEHLCSDYRALFCDKAGNDERTAFLYDSRKISLLEMVGEVAVPEKDQRFIKLPGIDRKFHGFDRNPYLAGFRAGSFEFVVANVHLYFGNDTQADRERRSLEAYAVSRWGDLRRQDKDRYVEHFIVLGDFNLPRVEAGDLIYRALKRRGLKLPDHSSQIGSKLAEEKHYDQIMFFPGATADAYSGLRGVFDFDGAVFPRLWQERKPDDFRKYLRYYLSDHRPIWAQFSIE